MHQGFSQFIKKIRAGEYLPLYLIEGEETYYLDQVVDFFEHQILKPEQKDFNLHILEGKDTGFPEIYALASRLPVFSDYQVIIIREASQMRGFKDLASYVDHPNLSTLIVLVNRQKKADGKTRVVKWIKEKGGYLLCDKIPMERVPAWIQAYGQESGMRIGEKEAQILTTYLGDDLSRIANEIGKMRLSLPEGAEIRVEDIKRFIGFSRDYNVFEFPEAFLLRQKEKYQPMLAYFLANPKSAPFPLFVGSFYSLLSRAYLVGFAQGRSDREKAQSVGLYPPQWPLLRAIHQRWTQEGLEKLLFLLADFNALSLGIGGQMNDREVLAEFVGRMEQI